MGKYEKSATNARGAAVLASIVAAGGPVSSGFSSNQNGLTITRITIPTISTAGTSLMIR